MNAAAVFFVLAGIGGIAMVAMRLRGMPRPPTWLAIGHGVIAALGLAILAFAYTQSTLPVAANWALLLFVGAALGGLTLFFGFHVWQKALPIPLVLGHGAIGATGLVLLLYAIYA